METHQRLLKIVSTEDNSEVTILLPSDLQDQPFILPSQGLDGSPQTRHSSTPDVNTQLSSIHHGSLYQTDQLSYGQYRASKVQSRPYATTQQQQQQNQGQVQISQYQNRPVLSTTTRTTQSNNVWMGKDLSTWTPKLSSGKWLQQDTDQQKYYEPYAEDDSVSTSQPQMVPSSANVKIKSSLASIFPVKLSRSSSVTGLTRIDTSHSIADIESQKLDTGFPTPSETGDTFRGVSPQVPINLSSATTQVQQNDFQSGLDNRDNNVRKSLPVTGFSYNKQMMSAAQSPVYKSKLEKAVEQKHGGNMAVTSSTPGLDPKYHSGTLKRLLSAGIDDISAYKLFQSLDVKPQVGTFSEQSDVHNNQIRDQNQFLLPSVSTNKVDHVLLSKTIPEKVLPKKKEILLDKVQVDQFKEPYKDLSTPMVSLSDGGGMVTPQTLPRFAYLPTGLTLNQADTQHLQDSDRGAMEAQKVQGQLNQLADSFSRTDFSKYKQTMIERDGLNRILEPNISGGNSTLDTYTSSFVNDGLKTNQSGMSFPNTDPVVTETYAPNFMTDGIKQTNTHIHFPPEISSNDELKMASTGPFYVPEMAPEVVTEREYVNSNWGDRLMHDQWRLREEGHFCDAVFHCKMGKFKFHRIVMSAASPDFLNRDHVSSEEIQLELPGDILYENVCLFMKYIYIGMIQLTIENVQQIYRLSTLFDISDLNKYCYDFCKLAKLGHLIISSPYLETARQVHSKQEKAEGERQQQTDNTTTEPALEITDVGTIDQIADILSEKARKLDQSTDFDFDWLTSGPDQSNIPIRKRGRTRHKLNVGEENWSVNKVKHVAVTPKKLKPQVYEGQSEELSKHDEEGSAKDSNNVPKKVICRMSAEDNAENIADSHNQLETQKSVEKAHEHINELSIQLSDLPDPLATGKFDESQLIKQDKVIKKAQMSTAMNSKPTRKTMVTRFRGQPKTMTVLEAATHKKAKYDVPLGMTTRKTAKEKTIVRKNGKVLKSKSKNNTETLNQFENKDKSSHDIEKPKEIPESADVNEMKSPTKSKLSEGVKQSGSTAIVGVKASKVTLAKKQQAVPENMGVKAEVTAEDLTDKGTDVPETLNTDNYPDEPGLPKKPRLRKSTIDQHLNTPVKDPIYMRPPKKRTKEIREMMKIDADVSETTKSDSQQADKNLTGSDVKQKTSAGQVRGSAKARLLANAEFKLKKPAKSKLLNNEAILQIVYEVEQYGKSIEGEKQYRCCLCNSVFVFSKRVITHIINTHDIPLEETADYIDVQHKKPQMKKCDICGYVSKEINIYYIHFHKYFKHNVPLPKGWQPFKCDLCKKEFFTKFQLREHKLIHFEDNPFVCELCGSGFKSRTGLNSHMFHKHSSVRKHKCPECMKSFKTRTQMKVHQRTHSGEKPYGCKDPQCNYRSTTRGNMKLHLLNRHKYTAESVNQIMKELKSSINEPPDAALDQTAELWEMQEDTESFESQTDLAVKMEGFDVSHAGFETLVGAAAELASADKNFMASTNVNNEQTEDTQGAVNGQVQTIADQIMIQIVDSDKVTYNVHGTLGGHQADRNVKLPGIPAQNIPRHVELLMQTPSSGPQNTSGLQNTDLTLQDEHRQMISDFTRTSDPTSINQSQPDQDDAHQSVNTKYNFSIVDDDLALASTSGQHKFKFQPRDNRNVVKQTFDKKSLFKSAIQAVENEPLLRQEDGRLLHTQRSFNGPVSVPSSAAGFREQIMTEDQIIHDLRQVQGQSNFTGEGSNMYRLVENAPGGIVFTSQPQPASGQGHLQIIADAPVSPPAYHLTSQSELTATQSSLLLAHLQMRQGQDLSQRQGHELNQVQGHNLSQGHGHTLGQGQGNNQGQCHPGNSSSIPQDFSNIVVSQSNTTQFNNNEEHLYPGFYQENYQIENY